MAGSWAGTGRGLWTVLGLGSASQVMCEWLCFTRQALWAQQIKDDLGWLMFIRKLSRTHIIMESTEWTYEGTEARSAPEVCGGGTPGRFTKAVMQAWMSSQLICSVCMSPLWGSSVLQGSRVGLIPCCGRGWATSLAAPPGPSWATFFSQRYNITDKFIFSKWWSTRLG